MKKLLLVCIFAIGLGVAPAQKEPMTKGKSVDEVIRQNKENMHTIDVPNPKEMKGSVDRPMQVVQYIGCEDVNARLLEVIKDLTDAESINNEIKFEADNHLTAGSVYARRVAIIENLAQQLRSRAGTR